MKQHTSQKGTPGASKAGQERNPARAPYVPPQLEKLGNVRDLVLGGSEGSLDTGGQANTNPLP